MLTIKNKYLALLLSLFFSMECFANTPLVWQIENNKIIFWVTGIAHAIPEKYQTPPKILSELYEKSVSVFPESYTDIKAYPKFVISDEVEKQVLPLFLKMSGEGFIPEKVARQFSKLHIAELQVQMEHLYTYSTVRKASGIKYVEGYDAFFARKAYADKKNKKLDQLEDRSRRKEIWSDLCGKPEDHVELVRAIDHTIRISKITEPRMHEFHEAIIHGNLLKLEQLQRDVAKDKVWPLLLKCSVSPRNIEWANLINNNPQRFDKALILVGDGHVIGKDNFIELLQKNGFKATLISP